MRLNQNEFEEFNPKDFLNFASELNFKIFEFDSSRSAIKRTIFNRAYYATFLCLRVLLSQNTEYMSNPFREHTRLPNFIKSKGPFDNRVNEKIYKDLLHLKKLRHQSDYSLEVPPKGTKEYEDWLFCDEMYAIEVANKIISMFENRFKNS